MRPRYRQLCWLLLFDVVFMASAGAMWMAGRATPALSILAAGVVLLIWQSCLFLSRWRQADSFQFELNIKKQHYLQAFVQGSHYLYWGCYWDLVLAWAPLIFVQLVFAYLLDALLSWSRGRQWQLGFGPFPIVGSINLFLWFRDEYFYLQLLLVAFAYFAKEFVTWTRNGKRSHIFNPSAIALATAGLALMLTNSVNLSLGVDLINSFYLPPNFYEFMFLFGVLLQFFFATTLVTWGAVLAQCMVFFGSKYLLGNPITAGPVDIAVFLGLNLLVTDPSTSPKSNLGKFLFGIAYGLGVFVAYAALRATSQPSYLDKILVVPIMNLMAGWFDRLAGWSLGRSNYGSSASQIVSNRYVHIAMYVAMFLAVLGPLKTRDPTVQDPFPPHAFRPSPNMKELLGRAIAFRIRFPDVHGRFGFLSEFLYHDDYSRQLSEDSVVSHIRLGDAAIHLGFMDQGLRHFERAVEIDPLNSDAIRALEYGKKKALR